MAPDNSEYTVSKIYIGHSWEDHILFCKDKLGKFHESRLILTTISYHNARKLDINNKVKNKKAFLHWKESKFLGERKNVNWNFKDS